MNYLGLNGILGLTGDADGPPVPGAGQIADLGGGALMGAVGIMVALRERERSGEGQLVDCSMFDGSLSWLAHGRRRDASAGGARPARGELQLAGSLICYRPYALRRRLRDARRARAEVLGAFCRGVGREDLVDHAFDPPGSEAHRARREIFAQRTREQWRAFASEHDCCLEPVLELDEVLDSELVAAREMVVELDQPGADRPVRLLGAPFKLSRTPADPVACAGARRSASTPTRCWPRPGIRRRGDRRAARGRRRWRDRAGSGAGARSWRA